MAVFRLTALLVLSVVLCSSLSAQTLADRSPFSAIEDVKLHGAVGDDVADDTQAIQSAIDDACAARNGFVFFPTGVYRVSRLKFPSIDREEEACAIRLVGIALQSNIPSVTGSIATPKSGSIIHSVATGGAVFSGSGPVIGAFTMVRASFRNLTIRTYDNPNVGGLDLRGLSAAHLEEVIVDTGVYDVDAIAQPTNANAIGLALPAINNGASSHIESVTVIGYHTGVVFGEHALVVQLSTWGCYYAGEIGNQNHAALVVRWLDTHSRNGLRVTVTATPHPRLDVQQFAIELVNRRTGSPEWQRRQADVIDPQNLLFGTARYALVEANVGPIGSSGFMKVGGSNFSSTNIGN